MLTEIQSRIARIMARNRSESSYFAGGAVLNENTERLSDDLDLFNDTEEMIADVVVHDINALEKAGFDVVVDIEIPGCTEVTVSHAEQTTQVQWMAESRMRYFPLVTDSQWGFRLHGSDLAVNKAIAASTRRKARDTLDIALVCRDFCPLGPLFLGGSFKIRSLSPLALLDNARHRTVAMPNHELEDLRGLPEGWNASTVKTYVLEHLDVAEQYLKNLPDQMLGGLPVDEDGIPVDRIENMVTLRPLVDGGGRFPEFPESVPDFSC